MTKKPCKLLLASILFISLSLSLTGCGRNAQSDGSKADSPQTDNNSTSVTITFSGENSDEYMQLLMASLTGRTSSFDFDERSIDETQAREINSSIFATEKARADSQTPDSVTVQARNWSDYMCDYTAETLTPAQRELWFRLKVLAEDYMNNCDLNGSLQNDTYFCYGIDFSDLGFSKDDAIDLAWWFRYSNPQYWFLNNVLGFTDSTVFMSVYDIAADGYDRGAITNSLFGTIDNMVDEISSQPTDYDKVKYANNLVCDEVEYVFGDYDQSIYSTFTQKETVCAGYAGAMTVLLNKADVETVTVLSENHAWNSVHMKDGLWYGEDATWNDGPQRDLFLLVSEEQLKSSDNDSGAHNMIGYAIGWVPVLANHNYDPENAVQSLEAPGDLTLTYVNSDSARAEWIASPGAESYEIQVLINSQVVLTKSLEIPSVVLCGLGEEPIVFQVRAVRGGAYSSWVSCEYTHKSSGDVETVPVPRNFKITASGSDYLETGWDSVEGAEYELLLFRDPEYAIQLDRIFTGATSAVFSSLTADQTYYVRLRAVKDSAGNPVYSDWADLTAATEAKEDFDFAELPLSLPAPGTPHSSYIDDNTVRITWSAVPDAVEYELLVSYDSNFNDLAGKVETGRTAIQLTDVQPDSEIYVRIRAMVIGKDTTLYSKWTDLTVPRKNGEKTKLQAPQNPGWWLDEEDGEVVIGWTCVEGADHYDMELCSDSQYSDCFLTKSYSAEPGVVMAVKVVNFRRDVTVYVRVRSVAPEGSGLSDSEWVTFEIHVSSQSTRRLDEPIGLDWWFDEEDGEVVIGWTCVEGADHYDMELCGDSQYSDCFLTKSYSAEPGVVMAVKVVNFRRDVTVYVRVRSVAPEGSGIENSEWVTMEVFAQP